MLKKLLLVSPLLLTLILQGCSSSENIANLDEDFFNKGDTIAKEINDASRKDDKVLDYDLNEHESFFDKTDLNDKEEEFVYAIQELYINAVYSMNDKSYDDKLVDAKKYLKTKYGLNLK